jgi:hypothetical protein
LVCPVGAIPGFPTWECSAVGSPAADMSRFAGPRSGAPELRPDRSRIARWSRDPPRPHRRWPIPRQTPCAAWRWGRVWSPDYDPGTRLCHLPPLTPCARVASIRVVQTVGSALGCCCRASPALLPADCVSGTVAGGLPSDPDITSPPSCTPLGSSPRACLAPPALPGFIATMSAVTPARGCACGLLDLAHIPCSTPRRSLHPQVKPHRR